MSRVTKQDSKSRWQQSTVIITGAAGGLGQALAQQLSAAGAHLILNARNALKLSQLVNTLAHSSTQVIGDLLQQETRLNLVAAAQQHPNQEHILINNAAISKAGLLAQLSADSLTEMVDVNLKIPMLLSRQLLPWLKSAKQGKIVNIGSSFGAIGYPGFSAYCAAKYGLLGFTQSLEREFSKSSLSAHYLAPRAMETSINTSQVKAMNSALHNQSDQPQKIAQLMLQALVKNHKQRFFGWPEKLVVKINAVFPSVVSRAVAKDLAIIYEHLSPENSHEI